jgi:hypothetical protein
METQVVYALSAWTYQVYQAVRSLEPGYGPFDSYISLVRGQVPHYQHYFSIKKLRSRAVKRLCHISQFFSDRARNRSLACQTEIQSPWPSVGLEVARFQPLAAHSFLLGYIVGWKVASKVFCGPFTLPIWENAGQRAALVL